MCKFNEKTVYTLNSAKHQTTPLSFYIYLEGKVHLFVFVVAPPTQVLLNKIANISWLLSKKRKCCKCSRPKRVLLHLCFLLDAK
jgi:hypothetical protein